MIGELNKRSYQRMMINALVKIEVHGEVHQGSCKDLSATGMSFTLEDIPLTLGDSVALFLGGQGVPPLSAQGTVVRSDDKLYAVEFTSIS